MDADVHHGGTRSLRCHSDDTTESRGASCFQSLNQTTPTPIFVGGWSRAENVGGSADADYAVYVDLTYTDGTFLYGQTAAFGTGTHGWQYRHVLIFPAKPLRAMTVYALFRHHTGAVWFDDFDARELSGDRLFDGQSLAEPFLPASFHRGWFVRDVAANSPLRSLPALGLQLEGARDEHGGRVTRATLCNMTGRSRAVTVYYLERFAAHDAAWWGDIRLRHPAQDGREYANFVHVSVGATGQLSLYPFCCVTGRGVGRALGVPPWLGPRVTRIVYHPHTKLLFAAFDLALTGHGDPARHDRAEVAVVHYAVDPQWGFRDAAAQFYALFPDAFRRRPHSDGIWMPFTDPGTLPHPEDFHIAFHEGDNNVAGDRQRGILSFRYVEPMTYWMPMAPGVPRTYAEALAQVRTLAAGKDSFAQRQAQAVLNSGSQDVDGRFNMDFRNTPWADGAVWVLNPSPLLPSPRGRWTKARLNEAGEPQPTEAEPPDGEYLDSLEGWADVLDYRPESLRASHVPPTFTPDVFRPCLPIWFSVYEGAASLAQDLHGRGKLLMANSTPYRFAIFSSLLDIMGTETDWLPGGQWQPDSDATFNLRRTLSGHKPYLLLMNTDFSKMDSVKVERYFNRCLFYGVFPSFFSADAADHPYWETPPLYNRDRPLFEKYIPVLQRLSAAGWEPVTYARSDAVWLERYGTQYLTVLNPAETVHNADIHIEAAHFWPQAVRRGRSSLLVNDALTGQVIVTAPLRADMVVPLPVQGGETRALSLRVTGAGTPGGRPNGPAP